jgi:hypothetical protein
MYKTLIIGITLLSLMLGVHSIVAQSEQPGTADANKHSWQVFRERDAAGQDHLIFVDLLTGAETRVAVSGQRYTAIGAAIMYFDTLTRRVMLALPNGRLQRHPFIQPGPDTRRVDWLLSQDGTLLAWTLTNGSDPNNLSTITTTANLDGTNLQQVFADGPLDGLRALPVAFNADHSLLYMDYQPDGVSDLTAFSQYAGLFALDVKTSTIEYLPDEPGCYCGAGFGAGWFLRLALTPDLGGFDLKVHNLAGEVEQTIPALRLRNYTQAGDIIISPDGSRAVYALAQIRNFGSAEQEVETVFMLVDLRLMTQTPLTEPITTFVRPIEWTEDNSAVLFTSPQRNGTWKVNFSDGKLNKVAEATYVGTISND